MTALLEKLTVIFC